jgi:hypothetical protein
MLTSINCYYGSKQHTSFNFFNQFFMKECGMVVQLFILLNLTNTKYFQKDGLIHFILKNGSYSRKQIILLENFFSAETII